MKKTLFLILVCVVPFFAVAEELVSSLLDESEQAAIVAAESVDRPLRQSRFNNPYAGTAHRETPSRFTLSGFDEPLTQKFIGQYTTKRGIQLLAEIVERSGPYLAFIRSEVERRGLPEEFIYLPVIESAYSATAVSRSGATGLWQFMRNSIGPYDMKVTEWMDERRDFWKSTVGALDKLENEFKIVGSWELALAAYNCGLGTVRNAMKRHPGADYWELCQKRVFKSETINYIPRLLAASHVLSNPRRYGLEPVWPEDPEWTRIPVGRSVDLGLVAEHASLDSAALKRANRELTYGITPPDPAYHIKVPAAQAQAVALVLDDPELKLIKYYFHVIRSGDTISEIAERYGLTERQVRSSNPGLEDRYLKLGQRLIIPAIREGSAASRQAEASSQARAVSTQAAAGNASAAGVKSNVNDRSVTSPASGGTHLVKRGETLWSIARAYRTSPETLAQLNSIGLDDILRVGSSLKTPVTQ
jgi:membrane-bound lytic murein transglycosylase D